VTPVWYPLGSDLNNNTFNLEDTVNTKKNWTKVTVFVVLALTSLSSIAMRAPFRDSLTLYAADVCSVFDIAGFDQDLAAIEWSVGCIEGNLDLVASVTDFGGENLARFEQYSTAIAAAEQPGLSRALAVLRSVRVPTFAPEPSTDENKLEYVPRRVPTFAPEPATGENKQFDYGLSARAVEQLLTAKATLVEQSNPVAFELRGWEWAAAPVPQNEISQDILGNFSAALEVRGWEWAAAPVPQNEINPVALGDYSASLELLAGESADALAPQNEIGQVALGEYFAALEVRGWEWAAAPVPVN
jgi:hypothetical protein